MKLFTSKPGFTLIETLFAVLLFTTSLVALMAVAGRGISSNTTAKEDLVARYLALEGLEVARNIRDTNYLNNDATPLETGLDCPSGCDVDYSGGLPELIAPSSGQLYVGSDGSYSNDPGNGDPTPFSRKVFIYYAQNSPDTEARVVSRVTWQSKSVQRQVEYVDYLKQWR